MIVKELMAILATMDQGALVTVTYDGSEVCLHGEPYPVVDCLPGSEYRLEGMVVLGINGDTDPVKRSD